MRLEIMRSPNADQTGGSGQEGRPLDQNKLSRDAKEWLLELMQAMEHNPWYKTGGFPEEAHPEFVGYYIDHADYRVCPVYRTDSGVFASIPYHPVARKPINFRVGMSVVYLRPTA